MAYRKKRINLPPPYLKRVLLEADRVADWSQYPFTLPLFRDREFQLEFTTLITIIVGENGVGKSTVLEAIAGMAGFDPAGGGSGYRTTDHSSALEGSGAPLGDALRGHWLPKVTTGWFFRAESFFTVARYLDEVLSPSADFLSHSHGEGFMRFFQERVQRQGIYFLDEPESALSPSRQVKFLRLLAHIRDAGEAQVIMATHSPMLMALPGARLLKMTRDGFEEVYLEETEHFRLMREFFLDPDAFVAEAMESDEDDGS